jgi:hypothetical protein
LASRKKPHEHRHPAMLEQREAFVEAVTSFLTQ